MCFWCQSTINTAWSSCHHDDQSSFAALNCHVKPCKGKIDDKSLKLYQGLLNRKKWMKVGMKRSLIDSEQMLMKMKGDGVKLWQHCKVYLSWYDISKRADKNWCRVWPKLRTNICQSNNAQCKMAIADFFHCENMTNRVVEFAQFKYL